MDIEKYKEVYDKYKNLKLTAEELGIKWQKLYWHLNRAGHSVTGDKERYGSPTDKMAREMEKHFHSLIPYAKDMNEDSFQYEYDFSIKGLKVDIKSSTKKDGYKKNPRKNASYRWAFSCKVQESSADFIVCFCMKGFDCEDHEGIEKILLIPKEYYKNKQSLSVSCRKSKWFDFEISEDDLKEFFESL